MQEQQILRDLTDGFSKQAKLSNQYWLLLILVSIISISKTSSITIEQSKNIIDLPLELGKVNFIDFNSLLILVICALSIAYASCFLQANKTRELIQRIIDNLPKKEKTINGIHIQDIFDSIVNPTFNRVSPISQFISLRNQFFSDPKPNLFVRIFSTIFYILLKIISTFIVFIIPLFAMSNNIKLFVLLKSSSTSWGLPIYFYWFISIITFLVFIIMIVSDIKYIFIVSIRNIKKIK